LRGDGTQHLSELASGEFARSTGAGDHLRQTLGHFSPFVRHDVNAETAERAEHPFLCGFCEFCVDRCSYRSVSCS
jgi:hypothetical protein